MTAPPGSSRSPARGRRRCGPRPYPHPIPAPQRLGLAVAAAVGRAVGAAIVLAALLGGFPAVLVAAAGWPLPRAIPTWQQVSALLTGPGLPDQVLINTLACAGWVCWVLLTLSAVLEVTATVRRVPVPHVPGLRPAQALIGALIAALALAPLLLRPDDALLQARPAVTHTAPARTEAVNLTGTLTLVVDGSTYTYPVRPGDTLWDIANAWLGDPHRWPEIYRLNAGHHFPDVGGTLTDPDLIYPGWRLALPGDARPPADEPDTPRPTPTPSSQPATTTTPTPTPAETVDPAATAVTAEPDDGRNSPSPTSTGHETADRDTEGVALHGGWIGLPFAAALTAAATLAWHRRRRRPHTDPTGQPDADTTSGSPHNQDVDHDGIDDPLPLPASVIAARRQVRRLAPDLLQPTPPDLTVRQAAQAHRDGLPVPPPPPPGPDGPTLAGLPTPLPADGLALTGPGASDAVRALLVATLTAGGPDDGDAQGRVVIPRATWQRLFPAPTAGDERPQPVLDPDRVPRLTVTGDLGQALTRIEADLISRRRLLLDADACDVTTYRNDPDHEPIPLTLLITTPPGPEHTDRLTSAARLGTTLNVTTVLLGLGTHATTLTVDADGHLPGHPARTGPSRLAVLDLDTALDLLRGLMEPSPDGLAASMVRPSASPDAARTTVQNRIVNGSPPPASAVSPPAEPPPAAPSPSRVTAHVLGTPVILMPDGTPVDSVREAALELLTYLAVHRDGADLDDIKEALYGDATRDRARQRLATDVANLRNRLRHALGTDTKNNAELVVNTGGRYHLNPDLLAIDWWQVQDAVTRAKHSTAPDERRTALQDALAAYHGPLADDRDYDWATRPREQTRRTSNWIHAHLARLLIDTDPSHAAALLETACDQDPYDEDLARLALQAHARTGNTTAIKTRMSRLRSALDELDETPDDQTEGLVRNLLARTAALTTGHAPAAERPRTRTPAPRQTARPR